MLIRMRWWFRGEGEGLTFAFHPVDVCYEILTGEILVLSTGGSRRT